MIDGHAPNNRLKRGDSFFPNLFYESKVGCRPAAPGLLQNRERFDRVKHSMCVEMLIAFNAGSDFCDPLSWMAEPVATAPGSVPGFTPPDNRARKQKGQGAARPASIRLLSSHLQSRRQ
jgi:hypothetical protein